MQSFLVITTDQQKQQAYLDIFHTKHNISIFDRMIIDEEGSLGIALVRALQHKLFLAPYQGKEKSIILLHAENLTVEAQNALLKVLEEPPSFAYIFLIAQKQDQLLPTILSRCQIIILEQNKNEEQKIYPDDEVFMKLITGTLGQKLALAEKVSSEKDKGQKWLEQAIQYFRKKMLEETNEQTQYAAILVQLQETYKLLQTSNVNPRLLLEHFLLSV